MSQLTMWDTRRPGPMISYYGSKWRAAKRYPKPRFGTVVEPFAGGAGYALRYAHLRVVLCDIDPYVCAVWRYLIATPADEIRSLPLIKPGQTVSELGVSQEAGWLIGWWLNAAQGYPCNQLSTWGANDENQRFWGQRVREHVARSVSAIRHWKIHEVSYRDCPVSGPATWFVDPPYQIKGKHYRHGSEGIDYEDLGQWCRELSGQAMVCEGEAADWLPFRTLYTGFGNTRQYSAERIWTNEVVR